MLNIHLQPFPVLYTDRLELRKITPEDAKEIFELRSSDEVMKYIDIPKMKSITEAIVKINWFNELLLNKQAIHWAITMKVNRKLIGSVLLKKIDLENHRAEIGYMLHPDFWRKGIVHETLSAILDFGFFNLNFHSIEAVINPENIASEKILEKNGFVKEAHFKENFYFEGQFLDSAVYSLLKSNYKKL